MPRAKTITDKILATGRKYPMSKASRIRIKTKALALIKSHQPKMRKIGSKDVIFELRDKPENLAAFAGTFQESQVQLRAFQIIGIKQYIVQVADNWYVANHDELMMECRRAINAGASRVCKAKPSWKLILETMAKK